MMVCSCTAITQVRKEGVDWVLRIQSYTYLGARRSIKVSSDA